MAGRATPSGTAAVARGIASRPPDRRSREGDNASNHLADGRRSEGLWLRRHGRPDRARRGAHPRGGRSRRRALWPLGSAARGFRPPPLRPADSPRYGGSSPARARDRAGAPGARRLDDADFMNPVPETAVLDAVLGSCELQLRTTIDRLATLQATLVAEADRLGGMERTLADLSAGPRTLAQAADP